MNPALAAQLNQRIGEHFKEIVGETIIGVRALTNREANAVGLGDWAMGCNPVVFVELTNGKGLILSADPEGNGPGWGEVLVPTPGKPPKAAQARAPEARPAPAGG